MMKINVGVVALIKNEKNEVLMMLRNKKPAKGLWAIPGGKLEVFEELETSIKREIKEELNLDASVDRLLGIIEDIDHENNEHWIMPCYTISVSGTLKNMEPTKHEEVGWVDIGGADMTKFSYMTKKVLELDLAFNLT